MLIYGEVVPLSQLSPGEWFIVMAPKYPDEPDWLIESGPAHKFCSIENDNCVGAFQWNGKWYSQKYPLWQKVRRCDHTR